eukprot:GHVU01211096.1.p1 GENE.GHVU01211096.1~~GHVU01211096.1.p1  ORF type:complete len:105 (+),score=13.85 GHVU01211096.1:1249-1563(+)
MRSEGDLAGGNGKEAATTTMMMNLVNHQFLTEVKENEEFRKWIFNHAAYRGIIKNPVEGHHYSVSQVAPISLLPAPVGCAVLGCSGAWAQRPLQVRVCLCLSAQ